MNDWENQALFQRNRLPARAWFMHYPDEASAVANDEVYIQAMMNRGKDARGGNYTDDRRKPER